MSADRNRGPHVANVVSGSPGTVVQAGVVHGGVHVSVPPRVEPVVPRQLPAAPEPFVGRDRELAELDRALTAAADHPPGTPTVVVAAIGGAGGMGKTWLALVWANRHLDRFPDGQLFLDLRGFGPEGTPVEALTAVRGFLDAMGAVPDGVPADVDAQAALFRSLVAERRMLILLDNAASTDQVAPLLPGGGACTVLVTSRRRLTGLLARHSAHPLHLDALPNAGSHDLLSASAGARRAAEDGRAVADLVRLCGGLPLALGVVGAFTRSHPRLPLADIATELREAGPDALHGGDRTASLTTVLSWSVHHLTAPQCRLFALLGIAPGPDIGLAAAACLTGWSPERTRAELNALEDVSLVDRRPGGRYSMHDLIRDHATTTARRRLSPAARKVALRRVLAFYTRTAHEADRLINPHRPHVDPEPGVVALHLSGAPTAAAWLDLEHGNLLAVQRTAVEQDLHRVVRHLAWVLNDHHRRRGHQYAELATWRLAVTAAEHLPEPVARSRAHRFLGRACNVLGHYDHAAEHLERALESAGGMPVQQAHIHRELARTWARRGDDRRALEHTVRASDLFRAHGERFWLARALNQTGWYHAGLGELDSARAHCGTALRLTRENHDVDGEVDTLDSLGYIAHRAGHWREAADHYHRALALSRARGDTWQTTLILDRSGDPLVALGRPDQAESAWREAVALYRHQGRHTDADRVQRRLDDLDAEPGIAPVDDAGGPRR